VDGAGIWKGVKSDPCVYYSFQTDRSGPTMPGAKELTPAQERILVESEKVLGKKGISGLELKNVAKVLKVAPSTINYYYASSEDLIFDTALFSYNKYVQRIVDEAEGISDPEKVLRIWIKNTFDWTKELPGIGVILEFPRQVIKNNSKLPKKSEELLKNFSRTASETGIRNVTFLCSAIRSVQKKQNFRLYKPAQIAVFIAKDSTYATFCSAIGFATLGGGLWVAGRQPESKSNPAWRNFGFNPQKQMQDSVTGMINLLKKA
jgi:AcrR family transcriptional regulator